MTSRTAPPAAPRFTPHRRRRPDAGLVVGAVLVGFVAALAIVSFVWTPHDPTAMDAAARLRPPRR